MRAARASGCGIEFCMRGLLWRSLEGSESGGAARRAEGAHEGGVCRWSGSSLAG